MLDEILAGFLANVGSAMLVSVVRTVANPSFDDAQARSAAHQVLQGREDKVLLTDDQLQDILNFLRTTDAIHLPCLATLLSPLSRSESKALDGHLRDDFTRRAVAYSVASEREDWSDSTPVVWDLLRNYADQLLPSEQVVTSFLGSDYHALLASPSYSVLDDYSAALPPALSELLEVVRDVQRLERARLATADISTASADMFSDVVTQQLYEDSRYSLDQLFVDRTLSDYQDESQSLKFVAPDDLPHRAVIIGDPGVGKSTLLRRLTHQTATGHRRVAPIFVRVREVPVDAAPLTHLIVEQLKTTLAIPLTEDALLDCLTIGKAALIFDGIDEITDLTHRRDFIRRIEALARRYPLCKVVISSRRIGYPRAKFNDDYRVYLLNQYSDAQVVEYTRRWFSLTGRPIDEVDDFLAESRTIEDVRRNPLMLSLLCTLHRAKGYIPQNRRSVYSDCADLLFRRWDAMRHVAQPFDHRQYGERLMQELAYFYYTTPSTRGALDERQLAKVICSFLTDTAGIDPESAATRASDFLEFCADRAWLLSARGYSTNDLRLFGFTHSTFLEFFSAEAMIRKSGSKDAAVQKIMEAYARNPSSLIAELMVQAAEDKYEGAAETLVSRLIGSRVQPVAGEAGSLSLCLRVANATPLRAKTMDWVLDRLFGTWRDGDPNLAHSEMLALLELYRDPMARVLVRLGIGEDEGHATDALIEFSRRYARLYLISESSVFDSTWLPTVEECLVSDSRTWSDSAVAQFLSLRDAGQFQIFLQATSPQLRLANRIFGTCVPGLPLMALHSVATGAPIPHAGDVLQWTSERVIPRMQVTDEIARTIMYSVEELSRDWHKFREFAWSSARPKHVRDVMLWLQCLLIESSLDDTITFALRDDPDIPVRTLKTVSFHRTSRGPRNRDEPTPQVEVVVPGAPTWFTMWLRGDYRIVPSSRSADTSKGFFNKAVVSAARPPERSI
ncbi:NACHT domain-containing protein [Phycicoccus sp.]|uniref:NACHT domain-containing protein n=1 Tax=Phycicoccus sp. TaxID=1902410 RepID=UPI002B872346|nr:NACHT domain-containing protein [Phycicoccus sp.]HMM95240.1 NACHT domain-containing protein [Phycicoccus sp.]